MGGRGAGERLGRGGRGRQLGGVLGRAVVLCFGMGSAFASLLERAELWVRYLFLCITQNREWVSYLGLPC